MKRTSNGGGAVPAAGAFLDSAMPRRTERETDRAVLRRGLDILECFSHNGEQSISSICRATGLPPATVHRMLAILIHWGGVERVVRGRYRLGLKLWHLGTSVPQARRLRDIALPFLEDLYEVTHEVVHLGVRDGHSLLYVEKLSGRRSVRASSVVGLRLPLHATGPGKVLLAFSDADLLGEVIANGLPQLTPRTITDPAELTRAMAEVRRTGVAVSRSESSMGTASVAAPIFNTTGGVLASVSVVVPEKRLDAPVLIPLVQTVARAISRHTAELL